MNKEELINLIKNSKRIHRDTQKEILIEWIQTGNKPEKINNGKFNSKYQRFYVKYKSIRHYKKLIDGLKELGLIN